MGAFEDLHLQANKDPALKAELYALGTKYAYVPDGRNLAIKATIAIAERYGIRLEPSDFNAPLLDSELESVSGSGVYSPAGRPPRVF
jgi:hypothetical protein